VTAVPTRVLPTDTAVLPTNTAIVVTETAVLPTNTVSASLPTDTPTAVPITPTLTNTPQPTEMPTNTPIPLPPPPGEIYFFLDPDPPPNTESLEQQPPRTYDLYRAIPGTTTNEWWVETIWAETLLAGSSIMVSPDETKLALLLLEDSNGDGELNDDPGEDVINIYIYDRSDNSIERLTNNEYNSFSVSWLPDSQAVTYSQRPDILNVTLDQSTPELLLSMPESAVGQLSWSPDGQLLVFHSNTQQLHGYHSDTGEIELISDSEAALDFTGSTWSPDGRWLAYMQFGFDATRRLYMVDIETLTPALLNPIEDVVSKPVWSTDSDYLAFTRNESTLSIWYTDTLTFTDVISSQQMSPPIWSPVASQVAVGLVQDGAARLITVDTISGDIQTIFESTEIQTIKPYSWSPDGEWVLFYAESGLYVLHVTSGIYYPIMDTSGSKPPWELVWLPTLQPISK
jgi:dipeptidyl aminopeptidase/acylaminoacyl peptidase